jgi:hypothetical protein
MSERDDEGLGAWVGRSAARAYLSALDALSMESAYTVGDLTEALNHVAGGLADVEGVEMTLAEAGLLVCEKACEALGVPRPDPDDRGQALAWQAAAGQLHHAINGGLDKEEAESLEHGWGRWALPRLTARPEEVLS